MSVRTYKDINNLQFFTGLSTDTKSEVGVAAGSQFFETDTNRLFYYTPTEGWYNEFSADNAEGISIDDYGGAADYTGSNGLTATNNTPAFAAAYAAAVAAGVGVYIPSGHRLFLLPEGTQIDITGTVPIFGAGSSIWGPGVSKCTFASSRTNPDTQVGELIGFRVRANAELPLSNIWLDGPSTYINNTLRAIWGESVGLIRCANVRVRNFRQGIWVDEDSTHTSGLSVHIRDRSDFSCYEVGLLHRSWVSTAAAVPTDLVEDSTFSVRDPLGLFAANQGHCLYITNGVNLISRKNRYLNANGYAIQHYGSVGGQNAKQVVSDADVFGGGEFGLATGAVLGASVCETQVYNPTFKRTGEWGFRIRAGGMRIVGGKVTGSGADSACVLNLSGENGPLVCVGLSLTVDDPGWCVGTQAGEPTAVWRFIGCNFKCTRTGGSVVEFLNSMTAIFEDCTFEDSSGIVYHITASGGIVRTSRCRFNGSMDNRALPTAANLIWQSDQDMYLGVGRLLVQASAPRTSTLRGRDTEFPSASGPSVPDATATGTMRLNPGYTTYAIPANNDVTIDTLADTLKLEGPNNLENLWIAGGPASTDPLRLYQGQVVTCIVKTSGFSIVNTGNVVAAAGARAVDSVFQLMLDGTTWRELP